ncbi:MAG: N-acetylmuramoyl-L-alanine amidase [Elusimicrobiota bacterium]
MRRIFSYLFIPILVVSAMHIPQTAFAAGQKIEATYEGEIVDGVKLYEFSGSDYFMIKEIAKLYKCTLTWHPVTGKVSLFSNNQRIDFFIKTTRIALNGKKKRIGLPIRVSSDQVYVPASFIFSMDFADFNDAESSWNPETCILNVEKRVNVLSPRFYSYPKYTQVEIELSNDLTYSWSQKNPAVGVVSIPRGKLSEETIGSDDGIIREIDAENRGREAEIKIFLTEGAGKINRQLLNDPRRIVINIERTPLAVAKTDTEIVRSTETPAASEIMISSPVETAPMETRPVAVVPPPAPAGETAVKEPEDKKEPIAPAVVISRRKKIIVLDAGHGGEDPGAIGPNGTKEKDINLMIVGELKRLFQNDKNYQIIITRKDDTFIPLVDRTIIANEQKAHLFVSVHCNASINRNSSGFEIYFLSESASDPEAQATAILENSVVRLEGKPTKKRAKIQELLWSLVVNEYINESSEICSFIGNEVCRRTRENNRGVKQAGFYVLRGTEMPAVLVECAFISHLGEESKLKNKSFQRKIADGIYEGIKRYDEKKGI